MRIPFDSLTLTAVQQDLQSLVGGKVQRISQPDDHTAVLGIYGEGGEAYLLLSCHPVFFRAHLSTKRPANQPQPPQFCSALRSRLDGAHLAKVVQLDFDRILVCHFEAEAGPHRLIAELMGKHSNIVLVDETDKIIGVCRPVGISKSVRPVLPGRTYLPPPVLDHQAELAERASPFLRKLLEAEGREVGAGLAEILQEKSFHPVLSPGNGAYPISVAKLGLTEHRRATISIALEQHYSVAEPAYKVDQVKQSLTAQLNRVLLARETALNDLLQARNAADRAGTMQMQAELVLAYGPSLQPGASSLEAADYEGNALTIRLDPALSYLENANKLFERAKRAKSGKSLVEDQIGRLGKEREEVAGLLVQVERADRLEELADLQDRARARRWLFQVSGAKGKPEKKPYEGHRIRELLGPGGAEVLFGENATANDYLTLRIAKPDDYWLHVRGSVSAHVVIRTNRHPEKVGPELLKYAAKIVVQNSPSKHSGFVPVDYTLRKYVHKPRGAPAGTALYTHEKTLHVES